MWQANRCRLNGNIKVVKLTFNPEVEQPRDGEDDKEPEIYPVYGVPTSAVSTTNFDRRPPPSINPPSPGGFSLALQSGFCPHQSRPAP